MTRFVSDEEMSARMARLKDVVPTKSAFFDTKLPEHERDIYDIIGLGVTENPGAGPAIKSVDGFNVSYAGCEPGKGAGLHSHKTVEVFIPLTGTWKLMWGDNGEQSVVLEQGDCLSVPTNVMRGFRNVGDSYGILIAVTGGDDPGKLDWAESLKAEIAAHEKQD